MKNMNNKKKLGIGVIGLGNIAQKAHIPWFWENPDVELIGACSDVTAEVDRSVKRWGFKEGYNDLSEMLKNPEIDAVSICTPVWHHADFSIAALNAGKHVMCEKPMARNLTEAKAMVEAAERNNKILTIGFMKRFNSGFKKIKQMIDDGWIGDVFHADIHWNLYFPPGTHYSQIFSEDKRIGGGVVMDNCSHYIDFLRWIYNDDVKAVYANNSKIIEQRLYEDQSLIILNFSGQKTGMLDMGFNRVEWVKKCAWDLPHPYSFEFSELGFIYGTKGTIYFEAPPFESVEAVKIKVYLMEGEHAKITGWHEIEVPVSRMPGGPLAPTPVIGYAYKEQADHFVECCLNNKKPLVDCYDGLKVVEVSDMAYESARQERKLYL